MNKVKIKISLLIVNSPEIAMKENEYILSVDSGTTATKVALYDLGGNLITSTTREYQLTTPKPLWVEIEIETLWREFVNGVKEVILKSGIDPRKIISIGISAQGETFVPISKEGKPLRRAIVWLDSRAEEEAKILDEKFDNGQSYKITGQVKLVPTWPAAKIFWLKRHEKDTFDNAYKYLLVEDYLIWRMTGEFVAEGSLLCSTCYWNIVTRKWWDEMLDFLELREEQLPEIRESGEPIGRLKDEIAKELNLTPDVIIATGGLDQACGTIGVGNIQPGIFTENIGAALAICVIQEKLTFDPKKRMPVHYFVKPGTYMFHTFTTGGMALRWFRDNFCNEEMNVAKLMATSPYVLIDKEVEKIPPGSEGLIMLPHLQGAMAPEANPNAKGVFFGITLAHTKAHFARSIMEAIACAIMRNIEVLEDLGVKVEEIRALGGGARSKLWNQIIADVTQRPVLITNHDEDAACMGAAMLAGVAVGIYKNIEDAARKVVKVREKFEPNEQNFEVYRNLYKKYLSLYTSLLELFESK
ncbi:MAG: FGGY-family carbohydrate kinase [Candidatus Bathyarchaeia archaeon]